MTRTAAPETRTRYATTLDSPVGPLALTGQEHEGGLALTGLHFGPGAAGEQAPFGEVVEQLEEFFAGDRTRFQLPLDPAGTPFQLAVWQQLRAIPYGQTRTYAQVAEALGSPTATRAVGAANGRNPLGIVVPCHRVIGADGSLTGFAGGLAAKRWLLEHERRHTPDPAALF